MNDRTAQLLKGLIREYIRSAEPVGSGNLKSSLSLTISPATIRAILRDLEDAGYIEQPHTSSGRVPTDQGYRYYVDNTDREDKERKKEKKSPQSLVRELSKQTHAVAVTALPSGRVEQYGLVEFMVQPEGCCKEPLQEVSQFLDDVHEYVERLAELSASSPQIYIGRENPVMKADHTSMIVRSVEDDQGRRAIVAVVGPKRMDYSRNLSLLEHIAQIV